MSQVQLNGKVLQRIKRFMSELKKQEDVMPFLQRQRIVPLGFFDFPYKEGDPTLYSVEQKLKARKYKTLQAFVDQLVAVFTAYSDYLFMDDPLQRRCRFLILQAQYLSQDLEEEAMKGESIGNVQKQSQQKLKLEMISEQEELTTTNQSQVFSEKLQTLFKLRTLNLASIIIQSMSCSISRQISDKTNLRLGGQTKQTSLRKQ